MSKRGHLLIFLVLAATIWAARFTYSHRFGLYEDDFNRIPRTLAISSGELVDSVMGSFQRLSEHGKVLHAPTIQILTYLGGKLNGLQGVYWIAFTICLLNAWLFYLLLRRLGSPFFALVGGLAYSVFSADTTQALLTHALGIQPSLTYLLLAFHAYLSSRKVLAYGLAFLILLNYETPFPVFLAAPLLAAFLPRSGDGNQPGHFPGWKQWLQHILVLGGMLLLVVILRRMLGESRVAALDLPDLLRTPLTQVLPGMWTSLRLFLWSHTRQTIAQLQVIPLELMAAMFVVFAVVLWLHLTGTWSRIFKTAPDVLVCNPRDQAQKLATGIVLLALAYPISFTISAAASEGRDTRVHVAAVVGASWLVAWGATFLLTVSGQISQRVYSWMRTAIALGLATFFALQVGFGHIVQRDYVTSWQYQRQFWTQLLPLVSDARNGDIIVVEPSVMRTTSHIGVITWNSSRILELLIRYPSTWEAPPRVFRLEPGWEATLAGPEGKYEVSPYNSYILEDMSAEVEYEQLIFIENQDTGLVRHTAPLLLNGTEYPVKQTAAESGPLPPSVLYDLMILEP